MSNYDVGKAFSAIEDELMASMIRNMRRHRVEEVTEKRQWSMWQAEQLKSLERYRQQNRKKYGSEFSRLNERMGSIIREAKQMGSMNQEIRILQVIRRGYKGLGRNGPARREEMSAEFFRLNERKLQALIESTARDMQKAETAVLRMADDQYRKIIFNAQVYANTGAGTYEQAVDMAAKDFLSRGINCIEYANGARHTISDYAAMAIQTASKRAYLQGEGEKRQEWGISTVIMNKRGNPCPKCLPFMGKVLIDDVWSGGRQSDGPYMLMSAAIAAGLYHPNCKDVHTTYFEGISTSGAAYTDEELMKIEQDYKTEQQQQYAKRQAKRFGRLEGFSLDKENKSNHHRKAYLWKNAFINNNPEYLHIRNWDSADIGTLSEINNQLELLPPVHQSILESAGIEIEIIQNGMSHYDPRNRTIYVLRDLEPYEIVHEAAHALEDVANIWEEPNFLSIIEDIGKRHSTKDIIYDADSFVKPIKRIKDKRFISDYQGRVYDNFQPLTVDGHLNAEILWDYFSEGYRCYFENPNLLEAKDSKLYHYIKELADIE